MFFWLENTALAQLVGLSLWAYPLLLSLHITGLAIVVGIFIMRDIRVLGYASEFPISGFFVLFPLAWLGFSLNLLSGLLLFSSQASLLVASKPFLFKISFIVAGMGVALLINARLRLEAGSRAYRFSSQVKLMAMLSIALWVAAICAGRLIAYL